MPKHTVQVLMSADHNKPSSVILNVEHAAPIRYARSRILEQAGYRVIEASTGEEALLIAAANQPDLIVLDISLPDIDGLEVCRRLKAGRETSHIMVLQIFSPRTPKRDLAAGLEGEPIVV